MYGRIARRNFVAGNNCCSPASAFLRNAFAMPGFHVAGFQGPGSAASAVTPTEGEAPCDSTCDLPTYRLAVDIAQEKRENGTVWVVTANVPGFKKDLVSVEIKDGVLHIEAKREEVKTSEVTTFYRQERRAVNLAREIRLPDNVAEDGITASLVDGVLTITIPQSPEAQPRKVPLN